MFRYPRVVLGLLALWALIVVVWAMFGDWTARGKLGQSLRCSLPHGWNSHLPTWQYCQV